MKQAVLKNHLEVWELLLAMKRITHRDYIEDLPGAPGTGVLSKLYHLKRILKSQLDDRINLGFQSESNNRIQKWDVAVTQVIKDLEGMIVEENGQPPNLVAQPTLKRIGVDCWRRIQELIADFEEVFEPEVAGRTIFLFEGKRDLLNYLSPETFIDDGSDMALFRALPSLAQSYFENAGLCLAYGVPSAATSLSLLATEATLRYYYHRHAPDKTNAKGQEIRPDWGKMLEWLSDENHLPGGDCYTLLASLKNEYRNLVAHGRAYSPAQREKSPARKKESQREMQSTKSGEAKSVFDKCWQAARLLMTEGMRRPQLKIQILAPAKLDFDTAFATYLFSWNPEFSPIDFKAVRFNSAEIAEGELVDLTFYPNGKKLQSNMTSCLSRQVLEHLRIQKNYADSIEPLIAFVDDCSRKPRKSNFQVGKPYTADLADLFEGICLSKSEKSEEILEWAWFMFDEFLKYRHLDPKDPNLVSTLDLGWAYDTLCAQKKNEQPT